MEALLAAALLAVTYVTGKRIEARHVRSLNAREKNLAHILVIPSEEVAYTLPVQKSRFVSAGLSLSADYFRNTLAGVLALFGGRLRVLENVSTRAQRELLIRLKEQCADALCITGVRIEVMKVKRGMVEAFAYGTALYAPGLSPAAYRLMPRVHAQEPATHASSPPRHRWIYGAGALAVLLLTYGVFHMHAPAEPEALSTAVQEAPAQEQLAQSAEPAMPAPQPAPAFDTMSYEQLTAASKNHQREYDEMFRHFQNIYAKGALDKPDFISSELANVERAEGLRAQHYLYAAEVMKRTRANIEDMATAMNASPKLAARHTGRIDEMINLTGDLAEAEQKQLAQHKAILSFLQTRQGAYTLSGDNAIRFASEEDNQAFNLLNRQLLQAETSRNTIAEAINTLAGEQP